VTISEVAARLGVDADTLRWFERRGVLPPPGRTPAGHRCYTAADVHLLEVLLHLRRTGMPLREIAEFTAWVRRDPDGVAERLALLEAHHRRVVARERELAESRAVIEGKIADYRARGGDAPP
jgi:DNA-binding transcriptional MerR regulator